MDQPNVPPRLPSSDSTQSPALRRFILVALIGGVFFSLIQFVIFQFSDICVRSTWYGIFSVPAIALLSFTVIVGFRRPEKLWIVAYLAAHVVFSTIQNYTWWRGQHTALAATLDGIVESTINYFFSGVALLATFLVLRWTSVGKRWIVRSLAPSLLISTLVVLNAFIIFEHVFEWGARCSY